MSTTNNFDRIARAWLADGPTELNDRVLDAALDEVHLTHQRRRLPVPWRFTLMPLSVRLVGAALIGVVALGAIYLNLPSGDEVGMPSSTPQLSPTTVPVTPQPTLDLSDTAAWTIYESSQYGYQIAYPPTWHVDAVATRDWVLATDRLASPADGMGGSADKLIGPYSGPEGGDSIAVTGFAVEVPAGTSEDDWLASYYADKAFCPTLPTFLPITVDGHPGQLDPCYDTQAIVFIGSRAYVFAIHRPASRAIFNAFLSTVRFPSDGPGSSALPAAS
jgi:hypothetical protein